MKTLAYLVIYLFACSSLMAQKNPQVDVRAYPFKSIDGHYIEIYYGVLNASLTQPDSNSQFNKGVLITSYLQIDSTQILHPKRSALQLNENTNKDLIDITRLAVDPGSYVLRYSVQDLNDSTKINSGLIPIIVPNFNEGVQLSAIQLLSRIENSSENSRFVKNGVLIEPLKFHYFNNQYKVLHTYVETYNVDKLENGGLLEYLFIKKESKGLDTIRHRFKRRKPKGSIDPYFYSEAIDSTWRSGEYILRINVRNLKKELLSGRQVGFVLNNSQIESNQGGSNSYKESFVQNLNEEDLNYSLKALSAKINQLDGPRLNTLINEGTLDAKKSFLYNFWLVTSPGIPEIGYNKYMEVVRAVDRLFYDGFRRGFETDRGYIYLKYGRPDDIVEEQNDPSAPPYVMWFYYDFPVTRQQNVKFVFYNPSLAANQFNILHSTARGEYTNPRWLVDLYSDTPRDQIGTSIEANQVSDYINRRAAEIFNDN